MSENEAPREKPCIISLAGEVAVKQILVSTVFGLWDIVNNLTRLRPTKRERYRATIFGSAPELPGTYVYNEIKRLAAVLAGMGCDIITGGGPGLMQAAIEGAAAAHAPERIRSVGIRMDLPFEQDVNPRADRDHRFPGRRRVLVRADRASRAPSV
jgi:predicted Rossmann-fold nucleotide-binding protein